MPKIELASQPRREGTDYPAQFRDAVAGRSWQSLGDQVGLTQFGVNLMRLAPGAASSLRHWHEQEDEFVLMIEGELLLVEDRNEVVITAGDCAGFKAGVANGHHLVNRTDRAAIFLVVGSRAAHDRCHYPDVDLIYEYENGNSRYTAKSGVPYSD